VEPTRKLFGLAFENISIINIQEEFMTHKTLLADDEFRKKLLNIRNPVETPYLIWKGLPKNLLTYFLQRAVLGVEACVSAAVSWEAGALHLLTDELRQKVENPSSLGGGTAESVYNRLPGLLDQAHALRCCDPSLWGGHQAVLQRNSQSVIPRPPALPSRSRTGIRSICPTRFRSGLDRNLVPLAAGIRVKMSPRP
jgi:hypothetical protein